MSAGTSSFLPVERDGFRPLCVPFLSLSPLASELTLHLKQRLRRTLNRQGPPSRTLPLLVFLFLFVRFLHPLLTSSVDGFTSSVTASHPLPIPAGRWDRACSVQGILQAAQHYGQGLSGPFYFSIILYALYFSFSLQALSLTASFNSPTPRQRPLGQIAFLQYRLGALFVQYWVPSDAGRSTSGSGYTFLPVRTAFAPSDHILIVPCLPPFRFLIFPFPFRLAAVTSSSPLVVTVRQGATDRQLATGWTSPVPVGPHPAGRKSGSRRP
jgi:hypothetical protein